jgi:CPA2 family monovalent cation:H+ antiporter-2
MAASSGLIANETAQFMLIVTSMTMFSTPLVAHLARRMALLVEVSEGRHGRSHAEPPAGLSGHIIVVGYGRVGQMLGSILEAQDLPHVALDIDASLVAPFHARGGSVFHGDATRPDILRKLGGERAAALVVTMDDPHAAERVIAAARRNWNTLPVYARAKDVQHAKHLIALGANHVVPEATEASLKLSEMVLMGAGVPDDAARQLIEVRRQAERADVDESRGRSAG